MLSFLPSPVRGVLALLLFACSTVFWCVGLYPFAILKALVRLRAFQFWCSTITTAFAQNWIGTNNLILGLFHTVDFRVTGIETIRRDHSYLICANHRGWVDIVAIQRALNRRAPFIRFFLKKELFYVPFLGLAWWALDYPFMKRYSKEYLAKHPEKRGDDLLTTRKACEAFQGQSISILNFLEGTRFTEAKHAKQQSPFKHLLKPKTGGIAFVLEVMGEQFDQLLDITLVYPKGVPSIWQLFCGDVEIIEVRVHPRPIPKDFLNRKYLDDENFRTEINAWLAALWSDKDRELEVAAQQ